MACAAARSRGNERLELRQIHDFEDFAAAMQDPGRQVR